MCVRARFLCMNANVKADVRGVKITVKLFRKNVICVKVSFLTAIFFSSVSVCFALLVCVCVRSLQPRENIWYRYATKNHLFQILPRELSSGQRNPRVRRRVVTTPGQNGAK